MRRPATALSLFALTGFAPRTPVGVPVSVPLSISLSPSTVVGGNPATGTILISSPAGNSGLTVTLSAPPGITIDAGANAVSGGPQGSTRISIPAGATSVTFRVLSGPVASIQQALISGASGSDNATATLTINPASVRSVAVSPSSVIGGAPTTVSIALDGPLASGLVVSLSAQSGVLSDGSVRSITTPVLVPPTVQPAPGQTSVTQALTTLPVDFTQLVTISAVVSSVSTLEALPRGSPSAVVTVVAPVIKAVQLSPASVTGGTSVSGTILLTGPAPGDGVSVGLSSSDTAAVVPPGLVVAAGSDHATFSISTRAVSLTHAATIGAIKSAPISPLPVKELTTVVSGTLVIVQPTINALSISPSSVFGGTRAAAAITLDGPAPSLGFIVRPSSSSALAVVPSSVTIPAGSRSVNVPIATGLSTTPSVVATISATGQPITSTVSDGTSNTILVSESGSSSAFGGTAATLTISSQVLASFTAPDSARGSSGFTILLAPASGVTAPVTVALVTNHPELLGLPATVQISPSLTSKVLVTTKAVSTRISGVSITASAGSSVIARTMVLTP